MGGEKISLCMCVNKFMLREKERMVCLEFRFEVQRGAGYLNNVRKDERKKEREIHDLALRG